MAHVVTACRPTGLRLTFKNPQQPSNCGIVAIVAIVEIVERCAQRKLFLEAAKYGYRHSPFPQPWRR
jgi:hypothetical protein